MLDHLLERLLGFADPANYSMVLKILTFNINLESKGGNFGQITDFDIIIIFILPNNFL